MRFRAWIFFLCFGIFYCAFFDLFPTKQEPVQTMDFKALQNNGKLAGRNINLDGGYWHGAYSEIERKGKIVSVSMLLSADDSPPLNNEKPEIRIVYSPEIPAGTTSEKLDEIIKGLVPPVFAGCADTFDDKDLLKELIDAGYKVKTPMIRISTCSTLAEKTSPSLWSFLAGLVVLFGTYRFLRLFRICYIERKNDEFKSDGSLLPGAATAQEAMRAAKAGYSQWKLLREAFFDAGVFYAPHLVAIRIKEAIPVELAKASTGAIKQLLSAKREGRFRTYLLELAQDRLILATNLVAFAIFIQILLVALLNDRGVSATLAFGTFFVAWLVAAKFFHLGARKGLSAAVIFCIPVGVAVSAIPNFLLKSGVLIRIPFFDDLASVVHPDLFTFPWIIPYAILSYVIAAYVFRGTLLYYTGKFEIEIGGRKVALSEKDD